MKVALIVAAAINGVIGRDNQLPWHLPQDLKYFKSQTMGKPIIMGRKTYESIGRPLPGRSNIVVTRNAQWPVPEGVIRVESFDDALREAEKLVVDNDSEIMVIGGAELYRFALPKADRIYLTRINMAMEGDAVFPSIDERVWCVAACIPGDSTAAIPHEFLVYERIDNKAH